MGRDSGKGGSCFERFEGSLAETFSGEHAEATKRVGRRVRSGVVAHRVKD